jgi:hypothetical protein
LLKATNSIVIVVTAQDGATKKTYTVGYTYYYYDDLGDTNPNNDIGLWYVNSDTTKGSDSNFGTEASPYLTVKHALDIAKAAYASSSPSWPGKHASDTSLHNPLAAQIHISGTITEAVNITDTDIYAAYPPILLTGSDINADKIIAPSSKRPLTISRAVVILGDGLTLTGSASGANGGVNIGNYSSFTMNGGAISGNQSGGALVGNHSSFIMNSGTISGNSDSMGGGVYVGTDGAFIMNGGTISQNAATGKGGGVYVDTNGRFEMTGGTIGGSSADKNTGANGSGVYVGGNEATFTMKGGTISGNEATDNGGGVYVSEGSFTMSEGTISGNKATNNGGGVCFLGATFIMNNQSRVSVNNANFGGGVYVEGSSSSFTMSGESSVNGNIATGDGGGVFIADGSFTMNDQSGVSGNEASNGGGGVHVSGGSSSFAMTSSSSVSGNKALGLAYGGGVLVVSDGVFTMNGGTISGNSVANSGGGVGLHFATRFEMSGGTISGNTAAYGGGGVIVQIDPLNPLNFFEMSGGTISGNTAAYGGGVHMHEGNFNMEGSNTLIDQDNDVTLVAGTTITVSSPNLGPPVSMGSPWYAARITPQAYAPGTPVLSGSHVSYHNDLFTVTPPGNGTNWTIDSGGLLQPQ